MDPSQSAVAVAYLRELGRSDLIPAVATEPDFAACAEMCGWLTHPMEFGKPPTEIVLFDTRELHWPPTRDRRRVWLFRYRYEREGEVDEGLGMVGSVTFALFGETTVDKSAEEVYGLHCAWELQNNKDERAPEDRSAWAGMEILARDNAGFRIARA